MLWVIDWFCGNNSIFGFSTLLDEELNNIYYATGCIRFVVLVAFVWLMVFLNVWLLLLVVFTKLFVVLFPILEVFPVFVLFFWVLALCKFVRTGLENIIVYDSVAPFDNWALYLILELNRSEAFQTPPKMGSMVESKRALTEIMKSKSIELRILMKFNYNLKVSIF